MRHGRCVASHDDRTSSALEVKPPPRHTDFMGGELTIGEVARRSGVATSALRFYEERGLIASVRNASGHRWYLRSVIRRVAFIVFAQRVGLSLEEVAAELRRLPGNRVPQSADWARLSKTWHARIDARIAELERLKAGLTDCIGCGCLSLKTCALNNPHDEVAGRGPGAVFLEPTGRRVRGPRQHDV